MSVRAFIGIVQAFVTPGILSASSISSTSFSVVMPGRHWSSGLRLMIVSNISKGAGSVAVRALPALPKTESTSGKSFIILSWVWSISAALVTETPGRVTGMYMSVPSFSGGMNSLPIFESGYAVAASARRASTTVVFLYLKTHFIIGAYTQIRKRVMGFLASGSIFPLMK